MENIEKVRALMRERRLDAVLVSRRDNFYWITKGNQNCVMTNTETGVATLAVTPDAVHIISDSSDMDRIVNEENSLGAKPLRVNWFESVEDYISASYKGVSAASDTGIAGTPNIHGLLTQIRMRLNADEIQKYRALGKRCAEIVEGVCRAAQPDDAETKIANRVKTLCLQDGINPDCVLVGGAGRIPLYRHPMPTGKAVGDRLMVVLGGEAGGLYISLTRIVNFGGIPENLKNLHEKNQWIFAKMNLSMKEGLSYRDYFEKVKGFYQEAGYADEWKLHHQGGPTGFGCREFVIKPGTPGAVLSGQAYAWNPTLTGTKCEDTVFFHPDGSVEILSDSTAWPRSPIEAEGGTFEVCDIAVL